MTDIGATLRETRMRARIDVSEIEAKTKIRARYLRALENEEWDLLPGPTFVRSFLRTYAQALGLDGKALVEEYRMRFEPPAESLDHQPAVTAAPRQWTRPRAPGSGGSSRGYVVALGVVGAIIVLLVAGLLLNGKGSPPSKTAGNAANAPASGSAHRGSGTSGAGHPSARRTASVSLSLAPSAPVYVCLLGDGERKLIPGLIIQPPYTPVTFHARSFRLTLGNSAVTLYVNGRPHSVPASSQAIGYSITSAGRRPLAAGQMPTCR